MKKIIPFTKLRYFMFILSISLFLGFGIATYFQGGFNSGIDFVGGWNIQVQFAPVGFVINYSGEKQYEITILDNKLTIYEVFGEINKPSGEPVNFNNYDTIGELAADLEKIIEGATVTIRQYRDVSPLQILTIDVGLPLNNTSKILVHVRAQKEADVFTSDALVREAFSSQGNRVSIQHIGNNDLDQMYVLKLREEDLFSEDAMAADDSSDVEIKIQKINNRIKELLSKSFDIETIIINKDEFVGPTFSQELRFGALGSVIVALVLILIYITIRFKIGYALAAITALVHDVCIMIVVIGALQLEVTSATLAAVLTIIGYSLNDTIVVFDRIRENTALLRDQDRESIINTSITQSLSRTLITSITTLLAVVAIFVFTTGVIKDFAFNLIVGIIVGTYSSIFIASPVLLGWRNIMDKRKKAQKEVVIPKKKVAEKSQKEQNQQTEEENTEGGKTESGIKQTRVQRKTRKKKKKKKRR